MSDTGRILRLTFRSLFDLLDLVQAASDRVGQLAGLDEDALHWVGVSIRESVINAIKHGNQLDDQKLVTIEFAFTPADEPTELVIRILDQGEGFDPGEVADPLAPENMLKSSGRGIFFMRSFMDELALRRLPEGGMEVRMVKRLPATPAAFGRPA